MVDFNVDLFSGILLVEPLLGALAHDDSDATLGCAMMIFRLLIDSFEAFSEKALEHGDAGIQGKR